MPADEAPLPATRPTYSSSARLYDWLKEAQFMPPPGSAHLYVTLKRGASLVTVAQLIILRLVAISLAPAIYPISSTTT